MNKIITTLIFLAVLLISVLGTICIPSFEVGQQNCTGFSCVNESLPQHMSERSSFFLFLPIAVVLLLMLSVAVFFHKDQVNNELIFFQIRQTQKRYYSKLFNFIIEIFSEGILHAKIPALS
ncbi:MAG TPA: hypothetical protein PKA31_01260 [Candidatus Moranbacteria bacterium]|nr:hypothetical protein [Candidatus Moranbacteria bacterium]